MNRIRDDIFAGLSILSFAAGSGGCLVIFREERILYGLTLITVSLLAFRTVLPFIYTLMSPPGEGEW